MVHSRVSGGQLIIIALTGSSPFPFPKWCGPKNELTLTLSWTALTTFTNGTVVEIIGH